MEAFGLFHWRDSVAIQTTSGSMDVYLRTLGGVEDELRNDAALAASMNARTELEDESSRLYSDHIAPLLNLDREGLREVVLQLQRGLFVREARWRVEPYAHPDPPEDVVDGTNVLEKPNLQDAIDWKETVNSLRGELEENRKQWVDEQMEAVEEDLEDVSDEDLLEMAIELHKGSIIERAYNREWDAHTLLYGYFKDEECKDRLFGDVQEVRSLPGRVKRKLEASYLELDVFSRNPETLKNSS